MKFVSTRGADKNCSFRQALFKGLASDGGLYHPTSYPELGGAISTLVDDIDFVDLAYTVAKVMLAPELEPDTLKRIVERSFFFRPELRRLTDSMLLLELFHGPSFAFKDFGASFLASCMEELLVNDGRRTLVLVATSGDTGSAVAQAFHGREKINVVILYPSGRVSALQEKQMTTLGGNIVALEVQGSFDDCQRLVKEAFMDRELSRFYRLTSANSINLGRLLPQSFYYIYAYQRCTQLGFGRPIFCVPSGNFGNLAAGVYAWRWGLPAKAFIAATNINDVVPDYLRTGLYGPRDSVATLSNAMDVGNPSNFERLLAIFEGDWRKMSSVISGQVVTDPETLEAIEKARELHEIFIDPHTAVGYLSALRHLDAHPDDGSPVVVLSTAHPAKFQETVERATGSRPELPQSLARTLSREKRSVVVGNTLAELSAFLRRTF
jgi:threonine synthase